MKARKLIEGATYGPETLKVIGKAFDDAWSEIAGHFTRNGLQAQSMRLKLAPPCWPLPGTTAATRTK